MNAERFQQELSLIPVVSGLDSLPAELREAAAGSHALRKLVEERVRCDELLERAPAICPPPDFVERTVELALAAELADPRPAGRFRRLRASPIRLAVAAAAAVLLIAFALIYFRSEERQTGADPIDPEMLASLDLLLDWEALEEHQVELDLLASNELAVALDEFGEAAGEPR